MKKVIESSSVTPMFRCSNCLAVSHLPCLSGDFQERILKLQGICALFSTPADSFPSCFSSSPRLLMSHPRDVWVELRRATPEQAEVFGLNEDYTRQWLCNSCLFCPFEVEAVHAMREIEISSGEIYFSFTSRYLFLLIDVDSTKQSTSSRQFLVKFKGLSHRWCRWVDEDWLSGQRGASGRLSHFLRSNPPLSSESVFENLPLDWM